MLRTYSCTAADTVKTDSIAAALNFLPKNWKREEHQILYIHEMLSALQSAVDFRCFSSGIFLISCVSTHVEPTHEISTIAHQDNATSVQAVESILKFLHLRPTFCRH